MRFRRKQSEAGVTEAGRRHARVAWVGLTLAAVGGAYVSWGSIYAGAVVSDIGQHSPVLAARGVEVNVAAAVVAALIDLTVFGASWMYVARVLAGRPAGGWRGMAHAGIVGTLAVNLAAAESWSDVGWHLIAPAVWAGIVEFTARDILGDMRAVRAVRPEVIPLRLWITAPVESTRTTFRMLRTGETVAATARLDADRRRAAMDALRLELDGHDVELRRRVLRLAGRRLWAGTIAPEAVFSAIGWGSDERPSDPAAILMSILSSVRSSRSDSVDPIGSANRVEPIESHAGSASGGRSEAPRGASEREDQSGSDNVPIAREQDLQRIRAGVRSGDLKWPLVTDHVMKTLKIGPTYAKAAVRQARLEGDPRAPREQDEAAEAPAGDEQEQEAEADTAQIPAGEPQDDDEESPKAEYQPDQSELTTA